MAKSVPIVRSRSRAEIEAVAATLIETWSPKTMEGQKPFPIHHVCEYRLEEICGVSFGVEDLPPGTEGRFEGKELIVDTHVYEAAINGAGRALFTLAHELGHCVLHTQILKMLNGGPKAGAALFRRSEIPPYKDPEWQANRFAAALLMPKPAIRAIKDAAGDLWHADPERFVSRKLNVSMRAAEVRIRILEEEGFLR